MRREYCRAVLLSIVVGSSFAAEDFAPIKHEIKVVHQHLGGEDGVRVEKLTISPGGDWSYVQTHFDTPLKGRGKAGKLTIDELPRIAAILKQHDFESLPGQVGPTIKAPNQNDKPLQVTSITLGDKEVKTYVHSTAPCPGLDSDIGDQRARIKHIWGKLYVLTGLATSY